MELPWWLSVSTLMKRLCKSLLKKRLGDLILGDLDLDQLDVQLTKGTLLLSDLALNADYINRKLSGSAFIVQEGSIKSLLVKFPLPLKSCEIVVEELELVLAPSVASEIPPADTECSVSGSNNQQQEVPKTPRNEVDSNRCSTSMSRDVDEGVRRIANAVKLFLTSFNIKLKDVYVVFDPRTISDDKILEFNRSLVFRIKETEFGTHLSTDGLIKLNNFIKFQEAVIEFLKMDDVDALLQSDVERGPTEISSGHSTTAVLTGPIGGFSGTLNLSIPWCNGSLSLEKIDADVSVDSLQLRVQTSSIQWIVYVWDSLQNTTAAEQNHVHNTADMFMNTSKSVTYSSASSVSKSAPDSALISSENLSWSVFSRSRQDTFQDSFLTRAHVIQDWVPELVGQEDQGGPDSDCDESIDQFFECFEELRNSQMNLGNSGIWDWTCSVFNAITFASTLASGSDRVPIEAPTEKTLRASVAEICVVLSFSNEMDTGNSNVSVCLQDDLRDPEMFSSCLSSVHFEPSKIAQATISSLNMHHLEAKCQNFHLDLETYHQNIRFKASIGKVKLDEYYSTGSHDSEHASLDSPFLDKYLCGEVQAALPQFPFAALDHREETTGHYGGNSNELIKVELLQTFDDCAFHYDASSIDQDGKSMSITSLSIHLPPFIFWVHFHTIYMVLNFVRKIEFSTKRTSMEEVQSNVWHGRCKASMPGDNESSKSTSRTTDSPSGSLQVQIALSPARIIFCFPSESPSDLSHPAILDKFIIIDHTSSFNLREASSGLLKERSTEVYLGMPSTSMHLAMGNLDIYLVKPANKIMSNGRFSKLSRQNFSSLKIISVSRSSDHDPCIKMIWRKCPATGPEMVKKAWSLSTLHNQKITKKENGKGAGVSSSTTSQDLEESSSSIRQELLQSTQFLLHIQLSCVSVHVSKKDCGLLNQLLDHVFYGLSDGAVSIRKNAMEDELILINDIAVQTSVVFECSTLDVCTELDEIVEVGPLLQTELEGFWNCLKLSIENFTLLSFSNIGGVNHASFLWANHGQGELWGTISNTNEKPCEVSKDFLLVVCKDSASRRGDGEGTNVLSFGTAGCSVTHIRNPELCESSTSINVHSGTIVAPGGRFDWINAIGLLVSSGSQGSEQADNGTTNDSQAGESSSSSFFLELVDVAVSYEPHFKNSAVNAEVPDLGPKSVACLLAASSFQLSNSSVSGSAATDFNIQLRDLGFLICESTGSKNVACGYNVDYLHQTGYAKVAKNTFIEAVLRTNSSFWKLEILESQFDVGTCHDTTYGLVRLSSQLQQLYAPDMRDALVHLQSRWNSVQQASKQHIAADASDMSGSSNENLAFSEDSKSDGLLDDIIENAFYIDEDYRTYNFWDSSSHHSLGNFEMDDGFEMKMATPEDSVVNVTHTSPGSSLVTPEANVTQRPLRQNSCPQQIIDSYYVPEPLSSSSSTLSNEDSHCKAGDEAHKIVDREDSGWYNDVSLTIVENHVFKKNIPQGEERLQQEGKSTVGSLVPDGSYNLKGKILIHNMDVKWQMYAGDDWSILRKDATKSLSSNGRDCSSSLEFIVSGLNIQFDMYPDGDISVSKLSLSARGLNLCDQRRDAPWKMVLGSYNSKGYPRESCANALSLELESVRPEPQAPLEDYRLCLEILPLQLHLDQGQLNFLISFFQNDTCNDNPCLSRENEIAGVESTSNGSQAIVEEALLPFFQKFDVKPLVLRINYIPRQFDPIALGKGNYAELLNIVPWKGIDLKLKHVSAMGVYGWNSICETVAGEWLEDISKNQVHKLLKGLRPIRSLVAVGSGTKKLVSLPIKSYKKDGKLLKGIQRGAVAFVRSVSIEAVGLGVHLAAGAHDILLKTECALTAVPPPLAACEVKRTKDNIRANQPESAQQGIKQAYESLTDGLGKTASALIGTPLKVYNRGAGAGSALATAICAVPAAAVAPVSASARAVHYALLGLRNSLDPDQKRESMDKYIGPSQL